MLANQPASWHTLAMSNTPVSTVPVKSHSARKPLIIAGSFALIALIVFVGIRMQQSAADRDRNFKNALSDYEQAGVDRLNEIKTAR